MLKGCLMTPRDPFGRDIDLVSEREDRAIRRLRSLAVRTSLFQTSKTVARKDGMEGSDGTD